ncbi:hypothetical protein [Dyadobacter sp. LHD-138]|uniref:hypothetical protein n=1 Tax=Dyadobacter sp. LHD-138 TaxID=3071413 RepID=UPI0027E06C4E|nr:hypothetical protein [Dyadobacter sp. LHD-138]MDQ6478064.1 hypothetical protein [Dyadobacter sp. LHD-138]
MMKKLIPLLLIISVLFAGCKGDDGAPGADGVNVVGTTIEVEKVNFNTANKFALTLKFTDVTKVKVLESDAVLVYVLWETIDSQTPVWRLMPQSILDVRGVQYKFDYSPIDFSVFLEAEDANFNLATLPNRYTQNQTFRIVVIPSDFTARKSAEVDYSNYEAVKAQFNLDDSKIIKYSAN